MRLLVAMRKAAGPLAWLWTICAVLLGIGLAVDTHDFTRPPDWMVWYDNNGSPQ